MRVRVRLFASYREALGREWLEEDLPARARVGDLLERVASRHGLPAAPGRALVARRLEYVPPDTPLEDGDELALLPPLSGGTPPILQVIEEPIDVGELLRRVTRPDCGGLGVFVGVVREPNLGHRTLYIDYHAYPEMAEKVMTDIAAEAASRWQIGEVAIVHRIGRLAVGEASVAIVVAAPHRRAALEAASYLIEALKARVPIWKREVFEGGKVWIEGEVAAPPPAARAPRRPSVRPRR